MPQSRHGAGLAGWSIRHPVSVIMLTLAVMVLGLFSLGSLGIDLLPHIIYPEIQVRISDPGVPANIMEDDVTRQLEEQLAVTEDAIGISSQTIEGRTSITLRFSYGKDIDIALRDASTRLDRAKRFMPESIDPPIIFKRDPSQLPAIEFAISSSGRNSVELRDWVDYTLGKWLLNLPGVAAAEVGGGQQREIQILVDQQRLVALGLDIAQLESTIRAANQDVAAGRLKMNANEITSRTSGRFNNLDDLANLPISIAGQDEKSPHSLRLGDIARIHDGGEEERIRIRLDGNPGVLLSIQKQPQANTVAVVDAVKKRLEDLAAQNLIPSDIRIQAVGDEAVHIRRALNNATNAALMGAGLAMLVVYLFLGNLRHTLIIGSAIPIATLVTIIIMAVSGLTLNIMSLGGLALGIGMLVDSTIVMLENIHRHQEGDLPSAEACELAASEVNSPIIASTSTNLAAILPFLFIGGLSGLLFRELIITITAATLASMVVALTLVPSLAGRSRSNKNNWVRIAIDKLVNQVQNAYAFVLKHALKISWLILLAFVIALALTTRELARPLDLFLPQVDDGRVSIYMTADTSVSVTEMDRLTARVEKVLLDTNRVDNLLTKVGGSTFGRTQYQSPYKSDINVQLKPLENGQYDSKDWIKQVRANLNKSGLVGLKINIRERGIRGLHVGQGSDDLGFYVRGSEIAQLEALGEQMADVLRTIPGLRNISWTGEDRNQELVITVDRQRARDLGFSVEDIGNAARFAISGSELTEFIDKDRSVQVSLKLEQSQINSPQALDQVILFSNTVPRVPVRLSEVASSALKPAPATIQRDQQQRIVEVSASLEDGSNLEAAIQTAMLELSKIPLPEGYSIQEAGSLDTLQEGQNTGRMLMALAVFLVLVVMAVQYESLRDPLIILFSIAFASIGVALGLEWTQTPISMPVWLGMIMLAGIVVNNAIVLVEYIEIARTQGLERMAAIVEAGRTRLRPILMTTLTTVVGMLPLALGLGEGSEMLKPLAITLISGLSFSLLVSLLLIPALYVYFGRR